MVVVALSVTDRGLLQTGDAGPVPEEVTFELSRRMRGPSPEQGEKECSRQREHRWRAALGRAGAGRWRKRKRPLWPKLWEQVGSGRWGSQPGWWGRTAMCRALGLLLGAEGIRRGSEVGRDRNSLTLKDSL